MVPFAADALGWLLWEAEREFISTLPTIFLFLFFVGFVLFFLLKFLAQLIYWEITGRKHGNSLLEDRIHLSIPSPMGLFLVE